MRTTEPVTEPIVPKHPPNLELEFAEQVLGRAILARDDHDLFYALTDEELDREMTYLRDLVVFHDISEEEAETETIDGLHAQHKLSDAAYAHLQKRVPAIDTIAGKQRVNRLRRGNTHPIPSEHADAMIDNLRAQQLAVYLESPKTAQIIETYLEDPARDVPAIFTNARRQADGTLMSWCDWLVTGADRDQFRSFLHWNNHHVLQMQPGSGSESGRRTAERVDAQRAQYKKAVQQGISEGWLPPEAQNAIRLVDSSEAYMVDIFGTLMVGRTGYYLPGLASDTTIYLDPGHIEHSAKHEWNHALLGWLPYDWLNEATTEHIRISMDNGEFKDFAGHVHKGTYKEARTLIHAILQKGARVIDPKVVAHAYVTGRDASRRGIVPKELAAALHESWGVDVLDLVDKAVQRRAEEYRQWLTRMGHKISMDDEEWIGRYALGNVASALESSPESEYIFGPGYKLPATPGSTTPVAA